MTTTSATMSRDEKRERMAEIAELVQTKPCTPENFARFQALLDGFGDWERIVILLDFVYRPTTETAHA